MMDGFFDGFKLFLCIIIGVPAVLLIITLIRQTANNYAAAKEYEEAEHLRKEHEKNSRQYRYYLHGLTHLNDEGRMTIRVIKAIAREQAEIFKKTRLADLKNDPTLEVSEFEDVEIDVDLEPMKYDGADAVKVFAYDEHGARHHAGWISASQAEQVADMLKKHDCSVWMEIEGGKLKSLGETVFGEDDVQIEENDIFPVIYISYEDKD